MRLTVRSVTVSTCTSGNSADDAVEPTNESVEIDQPTYDKTKEKHNYSFCGDSPLLDEKSRANFSTRRDTPR